MFAILSVPFCPIGPTILSGHLMAYKYRVLNPKHDKHGSLQKLLLWVKSSNDSAIYGKTQLYIITVNVVGLQQLYREFNVENRNLFVKGVTEYKRSDNQIETS